MLNFKEPYNKDSTLIFLGKFLPEDFRSFDEDVKVGFKAQFIHNIRKIGEVGSLESLHIYEITHESENDPRVSLSKDSFRLLANFGVRKALIFFVSKKSLNYRLSLVTVDLKWEKGTRIEKEYSNPRRYSFFLGPDARVHTPNDFLIKKQRVNNIEDLISRFDVELVTKEFFEKYRSLYEDIRNYLNKDHAFKNFSSRSDINIDTFAKKLLGQIVFCYFLQRKGWLGAPKGEPVSNGDKDFMRALFSRSVQEKKDFFNDCLEYLFYDCLNKKADDGDYYREHFKCQIPFLNGGLFEPPQDYSWQKDFIHIPARIFSNKDGSGVLDVFDLYNFTVYEDDPVDREVSVDPEMLGKVFENLLPENIRKEQGAYYTPREIVHYMCKESLINYLSTETKISIDRVRELAQLKDMVLEETKKGTHPLKNETNSLTAALKNIKVCDPACGSGAFLVGMLHEITRLRRFLDTEKSEYKIKKETIQNCIYGVDIDPGAVEIAKLRLWLSLVVDYELKDIEPLPNLDYKIMCGNSLIEELTIGEEAIKLFDEKLLNINKKQDYQIDENVRIEKLKKIRDDLQKEVVNLHNKNQLTQSKKKDLDQKLSELNKEINPKTRKRKSSEYHATLFVEKAEHYFKLLKELHTQYFVEYDTAKKKEKQKQIETIELEFIKSSIKEKADDIENRIRNLNMQDVSDRKLQANLMKKKLEYLAIPEKIHNSQAKPYFLWKLNFFEVFQEKGGFDAIIANPPYLKERDNKKVFEIVNNSEFGKQYHQGKMDYWYYFLHKAIDLSKKDGAISYITSRYWLNSSGSRKLIQRIQTDVSFINVIDIGKLKVFDVVSGHHMVAVYQKNNSIDKFVYKKLENDISDIDKCKDTENVKIQMLSNKSIFQNNEIVFQKDELVSNDVINLGQIADISQGVVEAIDKLSKKAYGESKRKDIGIGDGVFVLNKEEVAKIGLTKQEKEILKKYIDPGDVRKYGINWSGKWLIYADKQAKSNIKTNSDFVNIKRHLEQFKEFITSSNRPYGLHRPREIKYFINHKIIVKNMFVDNEFALDSDNYFVGFSFSSVIQKDPSYDLKYILAVLNSQIALRWFYQHGKKRGAGVDIGVDKLRSFPIKKATNNEQKPFTDMVDKIMLITNENDYSGNEKKQTKVKEYERQIDQLVYKLYDLTEDEIKIVESYNSNG